MNDFDEIRKLISHLRRSFVAHMAVLERAIDNVEAEARKLEEAEK